MLHTNRPLATLAVATLLLAAPSAAHAKSTTKSQAATTAPTRNGFLVSALGPYARGGVSYLREQSWWHEGVLTVGFGKASAEGTDATSLGTVRAEASASERTISARSRFRLVHGAHAPLLEAGLGIASLSLTGTSYATGGDSFTYTRKGTPPFALVGAGYGYRGEGVFRFAATIGAVLPLGGLDASNVSATSGFTADDVASVRATLDRVTNEWTQVHAYLELSIGAAF